MSRTSSSTRWLNASRSWAAQRSAPCRKWLSGRPLAPYPVDIYQVSDHIHALIERYAAVANAIHKSIDEADEAGDADTADIFTEVSRGIDKQLWFLEAHTQERSPSESFRKDQ